MKSRKFTIIIIAQDNRSVQPGFQFNWARQYRDNNNAYKEYTTRDNTCARYHYVPRNPNNCRCYRTVLEIYK